jgi:uncharacterized protein YjbI with pentapeptide repeats
MAQHQDAADAMSPEAAAQARALAERILADGRDFSDLDLTGADFSGMDLRGTRWQRTLLESADFSGCVLDDADFGEALLVRARFSRTSLRGAGFAKANMVLAVCESADFSGARFDGTQLDELRAEGCDFSDAKLDDLTLDKAHLSDCRFDRAQLVSVDFFDESELHRVSFDHARTAQGLLAQLRRLRPELCGRRARHLRLDRQRMPRAASISRMRAWTAPASSAPAALPRRNSSARC